VLHSVLRSQASDFSSDSEDHGKETVCRPKPM
jgi:hypothetical protein